jgi:hypothetical protein
VDQYGCAFLIDQLDADEIIRVIRHTEQQPQVLTEMVKACEKAATELTWEKEANTLLCLYQELLPAQR